MFGEATFASQTFADNQAAAASTNRTRLVICGDESNMHLLKQSTAATVLVGPVLDSTGAAYAGAVIGDFNLTKNGTTAAMAAAATATHDHNGMYLILLTTGNTDTLGRADISCNKSTYAMPVYRTEVLQATVFDALVTNATNTNGGLLAATAATTVGAFVGNATAALSVDASGRVDLGKVLGTASAGAVGYVGVDWGAVANKTTANALTGTTIATTQKVDVETIKTQTVTCGAGVTINANLGFAAAPGSANGGLIGGSNAPTTFAGTSSTAGLTITGGSSATGALTITGGSSSGAGISITTTSGDGITVTPTAGHALTLTGQGTTKHGINATGSATTGVGILATGGGTSGDGFKAIAGASGHGIVATGAGTTKHGIIATGATTTGAGLCLVGGGTSGDGLLVTTTSGHGLNITATGASKHGLILTGGDSGTSDGLKLVAGTGGVGFRLDTLTASGAVTLSSTLSVGSTTLNALTVTNALLVSGTSTLTGAFTATNASNDVRGIKLHTTQGTITMDITGTVSGNSTLTQTQVTGGVYSLNSSSFAFNSGLDFTTTQKAATLARVTLTDTATSLGAAYDAAKTAASATNLAEANDDLDELIVSVGALNNLSTSQVNAQVAAALATYDGPTHAEMTSELGSIVLTATERNAIADATLLRDVSHVEDTANDHSLAFVILASSEVDATDPTNMLVYKTTGGLFATKTMTKTADDDPIRSVR